MTNNSTLDDVVGQPTVADREVWACANLLIQQHGEDAWFWAAQRADKLFAEGSLDGQRTFLRIMKRIEQLQQVTPDQSVH